ncbi:hypothetical protein BZA05DRAFT_417992 [Tricharina praecox]|uniref:uncharacterized protein n=1 Tax=Tricharina praecox TaxID=43433 RepID=UPI00221EE840|nr:uncharacterized protein BZA05DRAFT_417992 [Tricharina praecox]KAI5853922.1 hypothetical protein BZA05DRAFT_417992 [Tricharina praecox]
MPAAGHGKSTFFLFLFPSSSRQPTTAGAGVQCSSHDSEILASYFSPFRVPTHRLVLCVHICFMYALYAEYSAPHWHSRGIPTEFSRPRKGGGGRMKRERSRANRFGALGELERELGGGSGRPAAIDDDSNIAGPMRPTDWLAGRWPVRVCQCHLRRDMNFFKPPSERSHVSE